MPLNAHHLHVSTSESYKYATVGSFGFAVTPPKHKAFAITTGSTTASNGFPIPFDILFRQSNGITFVNRITVPLQSTAFFPFQISGISGNTNLNIAPTATGLAAHNIYYYA